MAVIASNYTFDVAIDLNNINKALSQSFTGNGANLKYATFRLYRLNNPTGYVYAKLYAHSGTYGTSSVPTGSPLATSNPIAASSMPSSYEWVTFTFPSPYTVANGTYYCIVIEYTSGDATNCLRIVTNSSSVVGGNQATYTTSWTANAAYDLAFSVLDDSSAAAIRAVGTPAIVGSGAVTPTIPAGVQVGDLLMAIAYHRDSFRTFICSAGWDERYDPGSQENGSWAVYTRVYQAGDGNPTITPDSMLESLIGVVFALYNADISTIFDVAIAGAVFSAPGSPYDVTLTGFNTVTNGALAFYCWGSLDDNLWVYQSGGGTQQVSQDNTNGSDNSICIATESLPTAGATGDQVARQTNKAGDAGRKLWFAIKPAATGNSYSEGISLAATAAKTVERILALAPTISLAGTAAVSEGSGGSSLLPTLTIPATAGLTPAAVLALEGSMSLGGNAALDDGRNLEILQAATLPGTSALDLVLDLLAERALTLAGAGALGADGEVQAGAHQYQESISLAATAAALKTALLDLVASQALEGSAAIGATSLLDLFASKSLDGIGGLSSAAIIQATAEALLSSGGDLTSNHILARLGTAQLDGAAGISLGTLLQAVNNLVLAGGAALTPAALNAGLGLLSLAITAGLTTSGGFEGFREISLEAVGALSATLIYEMGAPLALDCLAALTLQSSLTGSDLITFGATGQVAEAAQVALTQFLTLAGVAGQTAAGGVGVNAGVSLPTVGNLAVIAELGLMLTCSLAGVASLAAASSMDLAGFLLLESVSAFAPSFGPRVRRGYRLEVALKELNLELKLD